MFLIEFFVLFVDYVYVGVIVKLSKWSCQMLWEAARKLSA